MRRPHILLVEDDPDDQVLTLRALRKNKWLEEIVVVDDGEQAIDYLFGTGTFAERDLTEQPALVLLDLKIPRLDGLAVLARIRADARTHVIPVVVLTSSDEEPDLATSRELKATMYLRKPIDLCEFVEVTCPAMLALATPSDRTVATPA